MSHLLFDPHATEKMYAHQISHEHYTKKLTKGAMVAYFKFTKVKAMALCLMRSALGS